MRAASQLEAPRSLPKGLVHEHSLVDLLLAEQRRIDTAVTQFARWHDADAAPHQERYYKRLIPTAKPGAGQQYAFEVNLDQCTGCKACVAGCHSLNGLDDDESWRDVGLLVESSQHSYQQTVTTACHHCADPACANGCPVLAYEKDAETGIVRHLDDQCIGCSYCILKCPYDVPKYNRKRGIVRKCDMCHGRLDAGEAPACVQACPTEAISIKLIARGEVSGVRLLPGVVESNYTLPGTRYISSKPVPTDARASNADSLLPEPAHLPLVIMLLLTQAATGLYLANLPIAATLFLFFGLTASVAHLGQPLKAWRAFLGWRKSWLSREILAFGALAPAGTAAALGWAPSWIAGIVGLGAAFTSVMVYVDTRRPAWNFAATVIRFYGSVAVVACAALALSHPAMRAPALLAAWTKLALTTWPLWRNADDLTYRVQTGPLRSLLAVRIAAGFAAPLFAWVLPIHALLFLAVSEFTERLLYFRSVRAYRMPGHG